MEDYNGSGMRTARATEDVARYVEKIGDKLPHLDKGLRENTRVNRQALASLKQLEGTSAQLVAGQAEANQMLGQIRELQAQANRLAAQQLYIQQQQLEVQCAQLTLQYRALSNQLQQVDMQRQQLALQVERETREAQENQLLRDFVDIHESVKQAQYAEVPFISYLLIVAAERIYAQLYRESESASNRLTLSTLRDKNLEILASIMSDDEARHKITGAYVDLFSRFAPLVRRLREASTAFDSVHGAYRATVCVSIDATALASLSGTSPYRAPGSDDPLGKCEQLLAAYEKAVGDATQQLDAVLQNRSSFEDDVRIADSALVPRRLGTGVDALIRFEAPVRSFRASLDEAVGEPFDQFVDAILSLPAEAGGRAAEARRISELLQRVRHRHSFVRGMRLVEAWARDTLATLDQHRVTMVEAARPKEGSEIDAAAYVAGKVRVRQGLEAIDVALASLRASPFLTDASTGSCLYQLFEICSVTAEVYPWLAHVLEQCVSVQALCASIARGCRELDAEVEAWRTGQVKLTGSVASMYAYAASVLPAGDLEAIEGEVKLASERTSERLLSAVRTKKGAELRRLQLLADAGLRMAVERAYAPLAIRAAPVVAWPI